MRIHADLPYMFTGYDVTSYIRSEATVTKQSRLSPQTPLGRILVGGVLPHHQLVGFLLLILQMIPVGTTTADVTNFVSRCHHHLDVANVPLDSSCRRAIAHRAPRVFKIRFPNYETETRNIVNCSDWRNATLLTP